MAKKSIGLIIGMGLPKKGEAKAKGEGMKSHKLAVARELIDAVKADDEEGVASALQAAYDLCAADEDYEEGDEEMDEADDESGESEDDMGEDSKEEA